MSRHFLPYLLLILCAQFQSPEASSRDVCGKLRPKTNETRPECEYEDVHRLVCYGGIEETWKSGNESVHELILCDWLEDSLNPRELLDGFTSLRKLVLVNSGLSKLLSSFPDTLETLDLRNNSLSVIDPALFDVPSLRHVYLDGNPLRCTDGTSWILERRKGSLGHRVADRDKLRCAAPFEGRPLLPVVQIIVTLKEECKRTVCDCELVYVLGRMGKHVQKQPLMAFASVNCSYRNLTEMPAFLPANTTTLRLTGNKIGDLTPLTTNPTYKGVIDLYLDDNVVESIVQLEGSSWLDGFRLLSLRGNKLTDLPTYALENVLLHSGNAASLYLGNNPWTCDCLFTPGFQDLLIRYMNLVKDINDVKCAVVHGDENSGKHIRDLTRTEICISSDSDPWLHPLDVLNIILASLILLVLGKLLYDYWSFKKTGKLPWIVSKIP